MTLVKEICDISGAITGYRRLNLDESTIFDVDLISIFYWLDDKGACRSSWILG